MSVIAAKTHELLHARRSYMLVVESPYDQQLFYLHTEVTNALKCTGVRKKSFFYTAVTECRERADQQTALVIGYSKENLKIHTGSLPSLTLLPPPRLPLPLPSYIPLPLEVGPFKSS